MTDNEALQIILKYAKIGIEEDHDECLDENCQVCKDAREALRIMEDITLNE